MGNIDSIENSLLTYIATRDRQLEKVSVIYDSELFKTFEELLHYKFVIVGGRTSCGGRVDPTWVKFTKWNEIIAKAKKLGYQINIENIKQPNKSPTMAGGFWNENKYTLI